MILTVRDMKESDLKVVSDYWLLSPKTFLLEMGADPTKLRTRRQALTDFLKNAELPDNKKTFCSLMWEVDGQAVGYSTLKRIRFGDFADVHLHMWESSLRGKGYGSQLFAKGLRIFFDRFQLKYILCEPYVKNAASNGVLRKLGIPVTKTYRTAPSAISLEMECNQHVIRREHLPLK